ncbi:MAG: hypothetical protein U0270_06335 [Labilithrix sp.]
MSRRAILAVPLALFVACELPSADEYSNGAPDGGAGSSASSGSPSNEAGLGPRAEAGAEAATEGGAAEAGVIFAADFEDGTCGPANFFQGEGGHSDEAHAGVSACQACRKNEATDFYTWNPYYLVVKPGPVAGQTYHARAFIKRGQDSFKDQNAWLTIRVANDDPAFEAIEEIESNHVTLSDTWQLLEATLTVTKTGQELDVFVGAATPATAGQRCFVIDEVSVSRD